MAGHNELGKKGEGLAIAFLEENDYKILERNYRFQKAEVDIIAFKDEILVGVEVKTRSTAHFGNPQEFVKSGRITMLRLKILMLKLDLISSPLSKMRLAPKSNLSKMLFFIFNLLDN